MSKRRAKMHTEIDSDSDYAPEEGGQRRLAPRTKRKRTTATESNVVELRGTFGRAVRHATSLHTITNPKPLQSALLAWYDTVHEQRGMPWRKPFVSTSDRKVRSQRAYEVWISEVMLQQTQVATVIPYYNRWMERFPTIVDLASSDIDSVNAIWKGLGYYSRAARLLSGAKKIVDEYNGIFPETSKDMMANVPGIGRYTAGAISSIAYNHCEPVLDGNVNRVMSRLLALHANPKSKAALDILWDGATTMVENTDAPGNINQALIELGATVCKPRGPLCTSCPLSSHCNAYLEPQVRILTEPDDIEELCSLCEPIDSDEEAGIAKYPMKVEKKKAREEIDVVNVIEWAAPSGKRYFLLTRRPDSGLLAGLYEFPTRSNVKDAALFKPTGLRSIAQQTLQEVLVDPIPAYQPPNFFESTKFKSSSTSAGHSGALRIGNIKSAADVLHIFSHIRKTYRVQWVLLEGQPPQAKDEEPPSLRPDYIFPEAIDADDGGVGTKKTKRKRSSAKSSVIQNGSPQKSSILQWVDYEDVQHVNIGTGVMKVWQKVNELWSGT